MAGNITTFDYKKPANYTSKELAFPVGTVNYTDGGIQSSNYVYVDMQLADISTASSAWAACPVAGTVVSIQSIISGAIATADAVLTPQINTVAITGGGITVATAGSAAGDVDSSTPTAANTVAVGNSLEVSTNGASTNTVICNIKWKIRVTAAE